MKQQARHQGILGAPRVARGSLVDANVVRIALALVQLLVGAVAAQAIVKDEAQMQDKTWQMNEPYWNPNPGLHQLADVAENEGLNNACPGQPLTCGDVLRPAALTAADNDYINFTANAGDVVTFGTDADGATPAGDTFIALYNSDCSTQLASDDDSGPGLYSLLTVCIPTTGSYVGRVRHFSATGTGTYKAFVNCASAGGYGDDCSTATQLLCGTVNLAGSTGCSTDDYDLPDAPASCTGFTSRGRDQVLKLVVKAGGSVDLTYTSTADGSIYILDTCSPLHCVAGIDATLTGQPEHLVYTFPAAGTYFLILDSFGTNTSGNWTLTGSFDAGSLTDRIETGPASGTITAVSCVTVPVKLLKGCPLANARAFSVTFQLSSELGLCGTAAASITAGDWGAGSALPLQPTILGGNRFKADLTLTGSNCIPSAGVLFNVSLRSNVTGTATGSLTVVAATLRDCSNTVNLPVDISGAVTTVPINIPALTPITDLTALQQRTGNSDTPPGTTNIILSFTPPGPGLTVELWRAGFGNYPAYDGFHKVLTGTQVDFRPASAPAAVGYVGDTGAAYNGILGWDSNRASQMVTRDATSTDPDQSFVRIQNNGTAAVWGFAIANGSHQVSVTCGDPLVMSTPYIVVEGSILFDGNTTLTGSTGLIQSRTTTVNVTDGQLTVQIGGSIPGRPDLYLTDSKVTQLSVDAPTSGGGGNGSEPTAPTVYPPGGPWVRVGTVNPGDVDRVAGRDEYYYVAFVKDAGSGVSSPSNRTGGTLNYHLGDVFIHSGLPNSGPGTPTTPGDNRVETPDVSYLADKYGLSIGAAPYSGQILDIGPTRDNGFASRPLTDAMVDFEDLVILGGNFHVVSKSGGAPAPAVTNELTVEAPSHVATGDRLTASLWAQGTGQVLGMSVRLTWDANVVQPVGVAAGPWLTDQGGIALSPRPGVVDMAILGGAESGLSGEGLAATVGFLAVAAGNAQIHIESIDGRDLQNRRIEVQHQDRVVTDRAAPRVTALLNPSPNPFNPTTTLYFTVAERGRVQLSVYSVGGHKVRTLISEARDAGLHQVVWDGTDDHGIRVASGKYFARLTAGNAVSSRTLVMLK